MSLAFYSVLTFALVAFILAIIANVKAYSASDPSSEISSLNTKLIATEEQLRAIAVHNVDLKTKMDTLASPKGGITEVNRIYIPSVNTNTGSGERLDVTPLLFKEKYTTPPKVLVAMNSIDATSPPNLRYDIYPEKITTTGFNMVLRTWADTKLFGSTILYVVLGS